jgi:predicted N-acetyltransferase YhbS
MISREHAPRKVKGHGAPGDIPVALLARLAVDRNHKGKGLGAALIRNALMAVVSTSETIAFRAVMVHALDDDAALFYAKYGFREARGLERTLLLPVKDIIASLAQA